VIEIHREVLAGFYLKLRFGGNSIVHLKPLEAANLRCNGQRSVRPRVVTKVRAKKKRNPQVLFAIDLKAVTIMFGCVCECVQ
jgi:hypothetical protein